MRVNIHTNQLPHQIKYAHGLRLGFQRCGIDADVVMSPDGDADIHVVLGPWFAKARWLGHPRVILLDRSYYRPSPDHVSLGWMRPDGGRYFAKGTGRKPPEVKPLKASQRKLFLADYGSPVGGGDVRYHPDDDRRPAGQPQSLLEHLKPYGVAVGRETTALVVAALEGLQVECLGTRNILSEPDWLELLPYADWSYEEIASGEAIKHLMRTDLYAYISR